MKQATHALAALALLCAASTAAAAALNFDAPGVIETDQAGTATYTEAGYTFSGQAASFLLLDMQLVGGFDTTPFSLKAGGGNSFSLLSLDVGFYDFGIGDAPGTLLVEGLLNGASVVSSTLNLGPMATVSFDANWLQVSELRFSANTGFALDNVVAVPEPGTMALAGLALAGVVVQVRRRRPAPPNSAAG